MASFGFDDVGYDALEEEEVQQQFTHNNNYAEDLDDAVREPTYRKASTYSSPLLGTSLDNTAGTDTSTSSIPASKSTSYNRFASRLMFSPNYLKFYNILLIFAVLLSLFELFGAEVFVTFQVFELTGFAIIDLFLSLFLLIEIVIRFTATQSYSSSGYSTIDLLVVLSCVVSAGLVISLDVARILNNRDLEAALAFFRYVSQISRILVLGKHDRDLQKFLKTAESTTIAFNLEQNNSSNDHEAYGYASPHREHGSPRIKDFSEVTSIATTTSPQLRAVMKARRTVGPSSHSNGRHTRDASFNDEYNDMYDHDSKVTEHTRAQSYDATSIHLS